MVDMGFALQLTGMALGALIGICILFIGLVWGLGWVGRRMSKEMVQEPELATAEEKGRRMASIAVAAVMAYLEAERKAATGAAQSKSKGEGGK